MNKAISLWRKYFGREKRLSNEIEELQRNFQVRERSGRLYLIVGETAFAEISELASAQEITALLQEARESAVKYKKSES
jgi:hypothetical protein